MTRVLVTGATGFTGGHLARRLVRDGCKVRALVLPTDDATGLRQTGIEIVPGDLRDGASLKDAVQDIDTVYHIAAVYREENIPRKMFWDVNVDGTRNLLVASKQAGVKRFVHCSTVGVQGEIANPPAAEDAPYNPGDYYQESKMEGELLALDFFRKEGLPGVVFRPVGIYGPGDTRFLKLFRFIQKGKFRMFGSGEVLYHLTYIDDLVDGIIQLGLKKELERDIFILAGEKATTLNVLVRTIADVLGVPLSSKHYPVWPLWTAGVLCELVCRPLKIHPPIYRRRADFFTKDRAFDISKARRELGYSPSVDLKIGLSRTAAWYQEQGLLE